MSYNKYYNGAIIEGHHMINTIPPADSDDPCDDWSGNDIIKTQKKSQR